MLISIKKVNHKYLNMIKIQKLIERTSLQLKLEKFKNKNKTPISNLIIIIISQYKILSLTQKNHMIFIITKHRNMIGREK